MVVLAGGWLVWALLATAVAVRLYTAIARLMRWLASIHLPRSLQALTAAILGASAIAATATGTAHATPTHATATAYDPAPEALAVDLWRRLV
ncbi:hypothetical protein [Micromonospora sp. NPDC023956]|uniref:hypothetical protein n=1 Tax=Micromonospora sp. NPDC023956 TaxID=3155722 RepID=UPI0034033A61